MDKLLRRLTPIVVALGLPRSGTSMMMWMLEAGGLRAPNEDNPQG